MGRHPQPVEHRDYSPGGSSGGSAAALAAGTTTLATGLGHRRVDPDPGVVLRRRRVQAAVRPGAEVEVFNLDHYCHEGPMARTVADCALLENVIAGPHPSDVASIRPKLEIPG